MFWQRFFIKAIYLVIIFGAVFVTLCAIFLLQSKIHIFDQSTKQNSTTQITEPFPVSVNSFTQTINESSETEVFFTRTLAEAPGSKNRWWNKVAAIFSSHNWYQNLASPVSRIIVIWPGERKEETTKNIAEILSWSNSQQTEFQDLVDSFSPKMPDGKYFPGQYVTHSGATPKDIQRLLQESFETEILSRYTPEVEAMVPLNEALIIASLLEREASDFENMREVAGVIWNRLFIDMPLQLDASLQYVRGSNQHEPKWWPKVNPSDKFIDSPFNTYKYRGLPPSPIANPSAEAILAALNPIISDCLYYFHTSNGDYLCSNSYEDHVSKLRSLYGRGS